MTDIATDKSTTPTTDEATQTRAQLIDTYRRVRSLTDQLVAPLAIEDCVIQSMPDVSPTAWHMAHTSWFFETFLLAAHLRNYSPYNDAFCYLFNSYYNTVGDQFPRPRRGVLSRPSVGEIYAYRSVVDEHMVRLLGSVEPSTLAEISRLTQLGLHHEQQHQELILTDIKHVLSCNPLYPVYMEGCRPSSTNTAGPLSWHDYAEGVYEIGHDGDGFCYDNEAPRHRVYQCDFQLGSRLITNGEYLEFIRDGGYEQSQYWLSDGWNTVRQHGWRAPLYWVQRDGEWFEFTLGGLFKLDPHVPVCHVSYYEADAYARWAGARLATEAEWEIAATQQPVEGIFVESSAFHPRSAAPDDGGPSQLYGDVWEWTSSPYVAYPGYKPPPGALGEYNGKFMCNQFVLRGGSCATSQSHIRPTYRNFFPPDARWQFAGFRLAR